MAKHSLSRDVMKRLSIRRRGGFRDHITEAAVITAVLLIVTLLAFLIWNALNASDRIDIDDVSELKAPYESVSLLRGISEKYGLAYDELLAVYFAENRFFPDRATPLNEHTLERRYVLNYSETVRDYGSELEPYRDILSRGLADFKVFPIHVPEGDFAEYMYGDGFSLDERHYGVDILDRNNNQGGLTLVSVCDGYVEGTGRNRTDGNYVIIGTDAGSRIYYYHLGYIAESISPGARVAAGQVLGNMGDTGTDCGWGGMGVRLHLGYAIRTENWGELRLNPYIFLRLTEEDESGTNNDAREDINIDFNLGDFFDD